MKINQLLPYTAALTFLFSAYLAKAQGYDETYTVKGIALGSQSVALHSPFAATGNPAAIFNLANKGTKKSLIGYTIRNRFLLAALREIGLGITQKITKTDALGLAIQVEGSDNLRQNTIAFAYSKSVNDKFSAGISLLYLNTFERTIGSKNNVIAKVGIIYNPSRMFLIGVAIYNPFVASISSYSHDKIPTLISSGVCYTISNQVKVCAEYKLDFTTTYNLKLGLIYEPKPNIGLCAGYQNSNSPLSFGMVVKTKTINFLFAFQFHQVLGYSPSIGFEFESK